VGERLIRDLLDAVDRGEPVVLATVVETRRSVPRHPGSKMLVFADGRTSGTIVAGSSAVERHHPRRRWRASSAA
jgi:xanthine dehydrogenase accessory factor